MRLSAVKKAIVAGAAVTLEALVVAGADNIVDLTEIQHVAIVVLTGIFGVYGVWKVKNVVPESGTN